MSQAKAFLDDKVCRKKMKGANNWGKLRERERGVGGGG